MYERSGLPEAGIPFPEAWVTVLVTVLVVFGGSGLTWSGVTPEMFLREAGSVSDGLNLIPWDFLRGSLWETTGVIAVMFLLVSSPTGAEFWLIPGIRLPGVVFDWLGCTFGTVFPASTLVSEMLPLEVLR